MDDYLGQAFPSVPFPAATVGKAQRPCLNGRVARLGKHPQVYGFTFFAKLLPLLRFNPVAVRHAKCRYRPGGECGDSAIEIAERIA